MTMNKHFFKSTVNLQLQMIISIWQTWQVYISYLQLKNAYKEKIPQLLQSTKTKLLESESFYLEEL